MRSLVFLILLLLIALTEISTAEASLSQEKIITPFGIPNRRQPPTGSDIKIVSARLGLVAQQTCGFTDWRTAQLIIPKQLLSSSYWESVGKQVVDQAKQVLMDLSGVIVPMLITNISPTFASLMNKAEMLATLEMGITTDHCKILDGIANQSFLQGDELRRCVQEQLAAKPISPGQAREICLSNASASTDPFSPSSKIANTSSKTKSKGFLMGDFIGDMFPDRVETSKGVYKSLTQGGYTYSRSVQTKRFMKRFFPGISVYGGATLTQGGTFQPNFEEDLVKESEQTRDAILEILRKMKLLQEEGLSSNDIIKKSEYLWLNKSTWEANGKPHPIYRPAPQGSEPAFLITPEQIVSLLPLTQNSKGISQDNKDLIQVIDRLTNATSYVKKTDQLTDAILKTTKECKTNPKYQDAVAQKNCEVALHWTRSQLDALSARREVEENVAKVQTEISSYVRGYQLEQLNSKFRRHRKKNINEPESKILIPGTY